MDEEKQSLLSSGDPLSLTHRRTVRSLWRKNLFPMVPARYVLAIMGFLGLFNLYILRVNLSMAIVAMVNGTADPASHLQYRWSDNQQGWALGAFFYGYLITQIPGGWLAERYGGKMVFGISIVTTSLLTLLTPLAAQTNFWLLVALRIVEGLFEGVAIPAMHAMWGKWAPAAERSSLATITYAGPNAGTVFAFILSGLLCVYGFSGGWPSVFYLFGVLGVCWFLVWIFVAFDTPASHPRISPAEKKYIESTIVTMPMEEVRVPWLQIATSPAMWAIAVAHFCSTWGHYTLITCIPTYLNDVLGLSLGSDLIQNGLFSAIPYTLLMVCVLLSGPSADYLRARWLSTTTVRKLFTVSAFLTNAVGLILTGYLSDSKFKAVLFLTLTVGLDGFAMSGYVINHIDIAPRFAGILMGITNSIGTIPGFVGPQLAQALTPNSTKSEWCQVFIIAAELHLFGACIYLILGDGKKQWWADGQKTKRSSSFFRCPSEEHLSIT